MDDSQPITQLFAVEAERMLEEGRALEAAQLCELGLETFPDYPTGYAILARAYAAMDDYEFALETIERGLTRFPLHKFLRRIKSEFQAGITQRKIPQEKPGRNKSAIESFLKEEHETAIIKEEQLLKADDPLKESEVLQEENDVNPEPEIPPVTTAEFTKLPEEELVIDDEIVSEDDLENPEEIEADPAVVEISEIEAEHEREEFEEVFKTEETPEEELVIDDEVIAESDVEEDISAPEADAVIEEISEAEAEKEREEFEEVFKTEELLKDEVLKENVLKEVVKPTLPASANDTRYSPLRIIETFKTDENQRKSLKSTSVRLIPGLEFAPLRFESSKKYDRHISALPEAPQFRAFRTMQRINYTTSHPSMFNRMESQQNDNSSGNLIQRRAQEAGLVAQNLTPLEELATRLEKARIPVVKEDIDPQSGNFSREPSVVTETMAKIYEMQGALTEALKAYQVLARQKPEKLEYFEEKIQSIQKRLSE